ncbi:MAG: family 10 glycosylhydrolase, partial [Clostridiaceae bacterium]|jgi:hypothetical protein|nr:family 10 glycosylhydrolase [Clostridiaceae bacterium]
VVFVKDYKELLKEALDKRRRVIFDNDGGDIIYCKEATAEALLEQRTTKLVNSGTDTLIYVTRSSGFGQFTFNTKHGQLFTVTADRYKNNITQKLVEQGTDCLKIISDFCHRHGIEVFWGMRMNDTHDAGNDPGSIACFENNKIKREHPDRLIGNRVKKRLYGAWTAVDYAVEEIRDLAYKFVEEVCDNYDIDGVHLDFFRHPVFFSTTAQGLPATEEEIQWMTALMERIKKRIVERSVERQKAILLSVRVPDSLEYAKTIGLDIEAWLKKGFVDILFTGGYFTMNDPLYSALLAKKYGVKYVASLDENRIPDEEARRERDSLLCYRARAMNAFSQGADGVFLFNYTGKDVKGYVDAGFTLPGEISEESRLEKLDKDYFISIRGMGKAAGGNYPYDEFLNVPVLNPANPLEADEQKAVSLYIYVGDSVKEKGGKAYLCIRKKDKAEGEKAYVNGFLTAPGYEEGLYTVHEIDPSYLIKGKNLITIKAPSKMAILDMKISVRYS